MASAARSNGTASAPCAHFVRFTERENNRLHKAAKAQGRSVAAFCRSAAIKALIEAEAEAKAGDNAPAERDRPRGLGIRERLEAEAEANLREAIAEPTPQPSITINVPTANAVSGNDVATLARGIVEAPRYRRRAMVEAACERLSRDARDLDEAKRLAGQLDEEVKRLESKSTVMDRVRARTQRRGAV